MQRSHPELPLHKTKSICPVFFWCLLQFVAYISLELHSFAMQCLAIPLCTDLVLMMDSLSIKINELIIDFEKNI